MTFVDSSMSSRSIFLANAAAKDTTVDDPTYRNQKFIVSLIMKSASSAFLMALVREIESRDDLLERGEPGQPG